MPRAEEGMAVAYDASNDTIWLIGGWHIDGSKSLFSFSNNDFIDHGSQTLSHGIVISYSQLNNILWMVHCGTNIRSCDLMSFNVESHAINYNPAQLLIDPFSCLASIDIDDGYLASIGGFGLNTSLTGIYSVAVNTVRILNLSTNSMQWLTDIPQLYQVRSKPTCIAHKGILYAIGGSNGTFGLGSVEIFDVFGTDNKQWTIIDDTVLLPGLINSRAVIVGDDMLIIGGFYANELNINEQVANNEIMVINTATHTLSHGGYINFGAKYMSAIIVYPVIYIFGGLIYENGSPVSLDKWQYHILVDNFTLAPSSACIISKEPFPTFVSTPSPTVTAYWITVFVMICIAYWIKSNNVLFSGFGGIYLITCIIGAFKRYFIWKKYNQTNIHFNGQEMEKGIRGKCGFCHKQNKYGFRCKGCKNMWYCSKKHQKLHWNKQHRQHCQK